MSVSSIGSSRAAAPFSIQNNFKKPFEDLKALKSALKSGDIAAAKAAFAAFTKDIQKPTGSTPSGEPAPAAPSGAVSSVANDLKSLEAALNSGDISAAQQAFASLQTDARGVHKAKHHGHHHDSENGTQSEPEPVPSGSDASATLGTVLDQAA